ncbi:Heme-binding protein A [bacterium HR23]|nr:Heme-binding protein A [bacterium HR23]
MSQRLWLTVVVLLAMAGLLACRPAAAPTPTPTPTAVTRPAAPTPTPVPTAPTPTPGVVARATPTPPSLAVPTPTPAGPQPKYGGTLRITQRDDPVGFDMHEPKKVSTYTQQALSFTHSRLLEWAKGPGTSNDMSIIPDLAESWEISKDGLTITVRLQKGVRWHPPVNRELTSKDVKWTFERMKAQSPEARLFPTLSAVETPDPYTVVFRLSNVHSPFFANLANQTMVIYAEESGKPEPGDAKGRSFVSPETVVGTGPFILESYQESVILTYKRNSNYFKKGLPYLDRVERLIVKDYSTGLASFRTGKLDILGTTANVLNHEDVPSLRRISGVQILKFAPFTSGENIIGRMDQPPWNNITFRRAVALAIDREAWLKSIYPEGGVILSGPIPSTSPFFIPLEQLGEVGKYYRYDPEEAKRLLKESGYDGSVLTLFTTTGYGPAYLSRTELIKDILERIGIKTKIEAQEYSKWIRDTYRGNYTGGIVHIPGWSLGEEDEWLGAYTPGDTRNHILLNDPRVNDIVAKSRSATSPEERAKYVKEFVFLFHRELFRVFLPYGFTVEAAYGHVKNYYPKAAYDHGKRVEIVWVER